MKKNIEKIYNPESFEKEIYKKWKSLTIKTYSHILKIDNGDQKTPRKVELFLSNGDKYEFDGLQDYYDNSVDAASGSITMRATFKNPKGKLINGDYGSVFIYTNNSICCIITTLYVKTTIYHTY